MGGCSVTSQSGVACWQTGAVTGSDEAGEAEFEFDWSAAAEVETKVANQFVVQLALPAADRPDGVQLIVGHVNPPVIVGKTEDSRREQLARYNGKLPVTVYARYYVSRARLEELRNTLDLLAEKYDEVADSGGQL